jgi:8-oxo-dGTP pyrophosphatase MutT (NUDIX family)
VHVVLYVPRPLRVLLLRRPESRTAGWQGVTGRVEERDATGPDTPLLLAPPEHDEIPTLARACLREIHEETGLPPPLDLEDLGLERAFDGHDDVHYRQRSFAARYAHLHPAPATPEHEEARWVPAQDALRIVRWESDRTAIALLLARETSTGATPAF